MIILLSGWKPQIHRTGPHTRWRFCTSAHFPLFSEEVFSEFCCFKIFLCKFIWLDRDWKGFLGSSCSLQFSCICTSGFVSFILYSQQTHSQFGGEAPMNYHLHRRASELNHKREMCFKIIKMINAVDLKCYADDAQFSLWDVCPMNQLEEVVLFLWLEWNMSVSSCILILSFWSVIVGAVFCYEQQCSLTPESWRPQVLWFNENVWTFLLMSISVV